MAQPGNFKGARERAGKRRGEALELRMAGATYRQIGKQLGVSRTQAQNDIRRALQELIEAHEGQAEAVRELEEQRLDAMLVGIWLQAKAGHLGAIDRALKIGERRARLLGLDAPTKIAPTDPTGEHEYGSLSDDKLNKEIDAAAKKAGSGEILSLESPRPS